VIPEDLRYSSDHEWLRTSGESSVQLGITDFAQDALGDIVFVQMPEPGTTIAPGDAIGEVESTKSVSDIYAPVTGAVQAVNAVLVDRPEAVNGDPYGEGWICELSIADPAELDGLLDAAAYRALVA
jgi:glycine cleavage system H protein